MAKEYASSAEGITVASTSIMKELQEHAIKIQKGFKKMSGKEMKSN